MYTREPRFPLLLEFTLVLGITYGLMLIPALWRAATSSVLAPVVFSDGRMAGMVLFQLFTGSLALLILRLNGWHRSDLHLDFSFLDLGIGLLLFLGVMVWHFMAFNVVRGIAPESALLKGLGVSGNLSLPVILLVCVINPLFEEGILLGYVMKVMRPQGFGVACGISVLLRLSTHLYQGPFAVITILPIGIIFSAFYWKSNKLWPVVFAHLVMDALPLLHLA